MDATESLANGAVYSPDGSKATARKIKKRELDRKAQRVARERTKNRIAQLETLVEQLKADNPSSGAAALTTSLAQVTQQRDELAAVLRSIERTVQTHIRGPTISTPARLGRRPGMATKADPVNDADILLDHASTPQPSLIAVAQSTPVANAPLDQTEAWNMEAQPAFGTNQHHMVTMSQPGENPTSEAAQAWAEGWMGLQHPDQREPEDIIVPRPEWLCDCTQAEVDSHPQSTWRTANSALGRSTCLSPAQLAVEDFTSQDTAVRVVLDGWDSVARSGKMSVSWRKLREVDETCFSTCRGIERLGILRTMHLLITYHGDPTPERRDRVPRWLWTRPSQTIPHSYAIDFFVWPGLRERFVFAQHRYCTNLFWQMFQTALRLLWSKDLEDCYDVDPETGRYVLSQAFDRRLRDINTWKMTPDFFVHFPELCEDIPVFGSIPPTIGLTKQDRFIQRHRLRQASTEDDSASVQPFFGEFAASVSSETGSLDAAMGTTGHQLSYGVFADIDSGWVDNILEPGCPWPSL